MDGFQFYFGYEEINDRYFLHVIRLLLRSDCWHLIN